MKRISFKDSGGLHLTQAVLSGRKTMTRRAMSGKIEVDSVLSTIGKSKLRECIYVCEHSPYKVSDIVAIQQAYIAIDHSRMSTAMRNELERSAGFKNKMFVKAELMPHHIRITDVRVERLQLIPYEDCLREGVVRYYGKNGDDGLHIIVGYTFSGGSIYDTPRAAFAALIDKVSGRGTWDSNPLVWTYSFELVD